MVTIAQRIEALRTEKGISRPALAAAVSLPRMSIEKFETGRQTPSPAPRRAAVSAAPVKVKEDGAVFGALLKSPAFQAMIKDAAAEYLKSPEGQALIAKAVRRELDKR